MQNFKKVYHFRYPQIHKTKKRFNQVAVMEFSLWDSAVYFMYSIHGI